MRTDADLAPLYDSFVGSEAQLDTLAALLRPLTAVPLVHVFGPTGSGKTAIVTSVLQARRLPHAYIDCVECSSERLVCESICMQLLPYAPRNSPLAVALSPEDYPSCSSSSSSSTSSFGSKSRRPCTSVSELARFLEDMVPELHTTAGIGTVYLVLDNCHHALDALTPMSSGGGGGGAGSLSAASRFLISLLHIADLLHPRGSVDLCIVLVSRGAMTRGQLSSLRGCVFYVHAM